VTYVFGFTGRSRLDEAFQERGLNPKVVFTATDADVIKTYVKLGMGVGIIAHMAYEPEIDTDLVAIEAGHLFEASTTKIAFRKGMWLRSFMFDFMKDFAPHLTRARVEAAILAETPEALERVFHNVELPVL
jgi:LysR family cys regulon transcriptional activator